MYNLQNKSNFPATLVHTPNDWSNPILVVHYEAGDGVHDRRNDHDNGDVDDILVTKIIMVLLLMMLMG